MISTETKTQPRSKIPAWKMPPQLPDPDIVKMLSGLGIKSLPDELATENLPGSDGEPMENATERLHIVLGLDVIEHRLQDRNDFYAGGNMFVYFDLEQAQRIVDEVVHQTVPPRSFRGPDMFVIFGVDRNIRREKWVSWDEGGHLPTIIFEFLSPTTRHIDLDAKKTLYEQTFATPEYFCFDYLDPDSDDSLLGWRLDAQGRYQPIIPNEHGWLWSEVLQLWVGKWYGEYNRDLSTWMRFYTPEGELALTKEEASELAAEIAQTRADQEAAARRAAEAEVAQLRVELEQLRKKNAP